MENKIQVLRSIKAGTGIALYFMSVLSLYFFAGFTGISMILLIYQLHLIAPKVEALPSYPFFMIGNIFGWFIVYMYLMTKIKKELETLFLKDEW